MLFWFIITLFVPLFFGVPVSYSLIFSGVIMILIEGVFTTQVLTQQILGGINNFSLLAVPFFILAGEAMNKGGISEAIVKAVMSVIGRIRGGLGYVTIISSMIFAGLSGSAIADSAALGGVLIPMMEKEGYRKGRATGLVICSAIVANIIPPSIGFIIYGVVSGTSITRLFMGGIFPGAVIGLALMTVWFFVARKDGLKIQERKADRSVAREMWSAVPALVLPVFIMIGLRGGMFTPTEAGAVAAAYAIIIGMFVYKRIRMNDLIELFSNTVRTTSNVMLIVAGSMVVSWVITVCRLSQAIIDNLGVLTYHPIILIFVCQIIFLIFGMVMDLGPVVLIMTPVIMPLVKAAGIDPAYFGILMIINLTFGLITPPVGTVLFVGTGISGASIPETLRNAWPFMAAEITLILLFALFPALILVPMNFIMGTL